MPVGATRLQRPQPSPDRSSSWKNAEHLIKTSASISTSDCHDHLKGHRGMDSFEILIRVDYGDNIIVIPN